MRFMLTLLLLVSLFFFFFFNDTATTEIYTLSLHDALPIYATPTPSATSPTMQPLPSTSPATGPGGGNGQTGDRKSTRLNSSHLVISYAVFCLKKKKKQNTTSPSHSPCRTEVRITR